VPPSFKLAETILLGIDKSMIIPEGIKLIPKGLYPDYPPSFSEGRKRESSVLSYVLKVL